MKMTFFNYIVLVSSLIINVMSLEQAVQYRTAQVLDYPHSFSDSSDLSVVVLACGGKRKMQLSLKSFFYFNTYPINKMYIAHCSMDVVPMSAMLPFGFQAHRGNFQIISATNQQFGLIDALENAYSKITTKYVYQMDGQWGMTKGFGFIEESINVIKHGHANSIKISQVVSNYPYWRSIARLTQMKWTETGQAFHEIIPFDVENYPFFSLTPAVFQFPAINEVVFNKSLKQLCERSKCAEIQTSLKDEYDKCCIWILGKEINRLGFIQVFLNDGTGKPNHNYIEQ